MRRRSRRVKAEMNVVPYIDVMLVLLVIFMIAAPLIQQSVEIDLPQSAAENTVDREKTDDLTLPLILSVDPQGSYYLNISPTPTTPLNAGQITDQAGAYLLAHPGIDVYVRGDAAVAYERIITGLDYLKSAGAEKVNLSTRVEGAAESESP